MTLIANEDKAMTFTQPEQIRIEIEIDMYRRGTFDGPHMVEYHYADGMVVVTLPKGSWVYLWDQPSEGGNILTWRWEFNTSLRCWTLRVSGRETFGDPVLDRAAGHFDLWCLTGTRQDPRYGELAVF